MENNEKSNVVFVEKDLTARVIANNVITAIACSTLCLGAAMTLSFILKNKE